MKNNWFRKGLVVGIIVLFIGVGITPTIGTSNSNDDTTPPVTTIYFNPETPTGMNGWYVSNVTITLEATDDISGVNNTYYSINSEPWEIYDTPFTLTEDSLYNIVYFSTDNVGNMEFPKLAHIKVDQTPPFISLTYKVINGNPIEGWDLVFTATAFDNMSGMERVEFYYNDVLQDTIMGSGPYYNWFCYNYVCGLYMVIKAEAYDHAGLMAKDEIKDPESLERFPMLYNFPLLRLILMRIFA